MKAICLFLAVNASFAAYSGEVEAIYRCGNEYTNTVPPGQAMNCKLVSGGIAPVVATNERTKLTKPQRQRPGRASASGRSEYEIETSHNDELFIINGEKFKSQTYCFDMEEGDMVIFLEGSPFGVCVSATLLNLRNKNKCDVWCE